ncbi:MAG: NADH-ubiquinone oxidoreductase chain N [uncultured Acidimicrobiales bacterium]|uniref:NADH-quinone oxidoreductase subunit N n=1 Tax=uncultured Acidimicrobiales bacterium TaxID=310071 RepID=A0A6J4I5M8_9ACTN|nr:MAG: NADH-ubiquinone oxidoreductase chain N [uncultured Acidimicrobiales bacterium]
MDALLIAQGVSRFTAPALDYHALAPEIILTGVLVVVLVLDLFLDETQKYLLPTVAGTGVLLAFVPVLTLALTGDDLRPMFDGAYVSDNFALVLKGLFLLTGYVVILMSNRYIEEGDYHVGEYYFLLLSSLLGMVVMASSRDLITIFVALELLSIPAYLLAGWRKRDLKSNEASLKYYLLGVLASGVMLYGMSLVFGATGTTVLIRIQERLAEIEGGQLDNVVTVGIFFIIVGFAFKVSAVPFHFWAPDTYEGAPTPITAYLSVASKTAGFVALLQLVFVGFLGQPDVWRPLFWFLAAITMTVGNLIALRQTNIVRMLAYSSVAQAGYILVPFAVAGENAEALQSAQTAAIVYLIVYAAMNLGAFSVILAVARKTRSGEITSFGGLFQYAPGLTVVMSIFLFSLAGIPPVAGWFAKFVVFRAALDAGTTWSIVLAIIAGLNSVVALFYYSNIARQMWMMPVPDGDRTPIRVPAALGIALGLCVLVVALGVYPEPFARLGDLASLVP